MTKCSSDISHATDDPVDVPLDCRDCGAYKLCMSLWLKTGDPSLLERVVKKARV